MKKIMFLSLLGLSSMVYANLVEFSPSESIKAAEVNSNFSYIKNLLSAKNVQLSFETFEPGDLILKENFEAEFNKLRLLGIDVEAFSSGSKIKSEDLNRAFNQSESGISIYDDVPSAQSASISLNEDTSYQGSFGYTNTVGQTSIEITSPVAHGTFSFNGLNYTYSPAPNYFGSDSFSFRVFDGTQYSSPATISINVISVNDIPTASGQSVSTNEDVSKAITLTGSDVETTSLSYIIVSPPQHGSLTGTGASVSYLPSADYFGPDSFTYKVSDGEAESSVVTVSITVLPVNDAPVSTGQTLALNEDESKSITVTGTDKEGSALTYTMVSPPTKGTYTGTLPNIVYTPGANYFGTDSFTYKVNDGSLDSSVSTITLNIAPVNDVPTVANQTVEMSGTSKAITLVGNDIEGSALTYTIVSPPSIGTISGSGSNITFSVPSVMVGSTSFTYKVNDGQVDSSVATVSINISSGNYFGTGADGDVTIASTTTLPITGATSYDGQMTVKNYKNLTVNAGAVLTNASPSRGMLIYVQGNLVVNGEISMSARGAYVPSIDSVVDAEGLIIRRFAPSSSSSNSKSNPLRGTGTLAEAAEANQPSVVNGKVFTLNRYGVGGGVGRSGAGTGNAGGSGVNNTATLQVGGGGGGGSSQEGYWGISGAGSYGTVFSGGSGGVGRSADRCLDQGGVVYGGAGGSASNLDYRNYCGGGAGNPGGVGYNAGASVQAPSGTGGLIILIVKGNITIGSTGSITSRGQAGGAAINAAHRNSGGGGSGGGIVLVLHGGSFSNSGSINVSGGAGGAASGGGNAAPGPGGAGGSGSYSVSQIYQ